ncbi:MAG: hypothetical protein ACRDRV_06000 [Pseudonocardiaceae bacterium]
MTLLKRSHQGQLRGIDYSIIDFASSAEDPRRIQQRTAAWLDSAEMANLLAHFGYALTTTGLQNRLKEAERISRDIFDFRQGGERWEAKKIDFPPCTTEAVEALIARIYRDPQGLPGTELGAPTHCLVMGGRMTSCLLRAELLAELLRQGLQVGRIWGLSSHRPIVEMERQVVAGLTIGPIADELDAVCATLRCALRLPDLAERSARFPSEVRRLASGPVPVAGLAAERGPGSTRATTSDTYRFFLRTAENVTARDHILVITSAIDAPFQHAQALADLSVPTGATITSVGAHIGTSRQAAVRTEWTTAQWLQEIRSAIWSMSAMYDTLLAAHPDLEQSENS